MSLRILGASYGAVDVKNIVASCIVNGGTLRISGRSAFIMNLVNGQSIPLPTGDPLPGCLKVLTVLTLFINMCNPLIILVIWTPEFVP